MANQKCLLTGRSSGRQHWPWLRHLDGQCWCPPPCRAPAPLTLGVSSSKTETRLPMPPSYKFPTPESCKLKDSAVLCTSDRILALYNQATGKSQQRITQPVKNWFVAEAQSSGWGGRSFSSRSSVRARCRLRSICAPS